MANANPAHIVLHNVRLSYVHLDRPYASQPNQEPKYSATILVPKSPPENRAKIDAAIAAATQRGREKFGQAFPVQPKTSVHDGDGTRPSDGQPFGEECKGCWVFTASNKDQPSIVDGALQPILNPTEIYSGIYANVGITFFPYNAPQNRGVGVALDNVQKIADGEPLGGERPSAEDDFQPIAAQPAAYPQTAYSQPAATGYPVQPSEIQAPGYEQPGPAYPPQAGYTQPAATGYPAGYDPYNQR